MLIGFSLIDDGTNGGQAGEEGKLGDCQLQVGELLEDLRQAAFNCGGGERGGGSGLPLVDGLGRAPDSEPSPASDKLGAPVGRPAGVKKGRVL